jgi:TolA-binding protein
VDAKVQVLERLIGEGGATSDELVASLAERTGQVAKLEHDLLAHRGFEESLRRRVVESQSELTQANQAQEELNQQIGELQGELAEAKEANRSRLDEIQQLKGADGANGGAATGWSWPWLAAATIAGLVCGGVFGAMSRASDDSETFSERSKDENEVTNTD